MYKNSYRRTNQTCAAEDRVARPDPETERANPKSDSRACCKQQGPDPLPNALVSVIDPGVKKQGRWRTAIACGWCGRRVYYSPGPEVSPSVGRLSRAVPSSPKLQDGSGEPSYATIFRAGGIVFGHCRGEGWDRRRAGRA